MKRRNLITAISITSFLFVISFSCSKDEEKENKLPTCIITSPNNGQEIHLGDAVTISVDAEDLDGNIKEVQFYVDGIIIGSSSSFPYNYEWTTIGETVGSHTLKATAKDNTGVSTSDDVLVDLVGIAPVAAFTASKIEINEWDSITFNDQSTNTPTSWNWDFGDGNTSTTQNPTNTYNAEGSYTVILTVTNSSGTNTETKTDYITVSVGVTDIDGNVYNALTIGTQVWMTENLKVTKYPNGNAIPLVTDNTTWGNLGNANTDDAYCYYDNLNINRDTYGALYTYAAAKDACPTGWHLPTDDEWKTLEKHHGMSQIDVDYIGFRGVGIGTKLKAENGWNDSGNGTDDYGFDGLPGGRRKAGVFSMVGDHSTWWSSTEDKDISSAAYYRGLHYSHNNVARGFYYKSSGYSVRCVRD